MSCEMSIVALYANNEIALTNTLSYIEDLLFKKKKYINILSYVLDQWNQNFIVVLELLWLPGMNDKCL